MKPALSCNNCRARKKKCDRAYPICSYCLQTSHRCIYKSSKFFSPESSRAMSLQLETTYRATSMVSARHLDSHRFLALDPATQPSENLLPAELLELFRDPVETTRVVEEYRQSIDPWMPLVPETQLRALAEVTLNHSDTDAILLLASIRIVTLPLSGDDACSRTYLTLKSSFVSIEAGRAISLRLAQARFLLLLYEFGHGLVQSAYFSLGICMQYLTMLNVEDRQRSGPRQDWLFEEQYRRLWWAGFVIDRVLNLGCPQRQLLVQDAGRTRILPSCEQSWLAEDPGAADILTLSSVPTANMGNFRLLVLAANLLGLTLQYKADVHAHHGPWSDETRQLYRTLCSFSAVLELEGQSKVSIGVSRGLINSAIFTLYCDLEMSELLGSHNMGPNIGIAGADPMALSAQVFVNRGRDYMSGHLYNPEETAPFLLHWGYHTYLYYHKIYQMHRKEEHRSLLTELASVFHMLNGKWKLSAVYMDMINMLHA